MRLFFAVCLTLTAALAGCMGPASLHKAVLGYDETVSRLDREILLLNIARMDNNLPSHFTVTSSIAATFDYRAQAGVNATFFDSPATPNSLSPSLGLYAAENPTLSIIPIQGEEFTERILTPMDESKFQFLVFQGAPIDMVLRLMAAGVEIQNQEGQFESFIVNWPSRREEYEKFRRVASHLAWLNEERNLFVGRLVFEEALGPVLEAPPSPGDALGALDKDCRWKRIAEDGPYELVRHSVGRAAITNYDPKKLSDEERQALNDLASGNPENFLLLDIRPGHPGGDFPLFGAIKLRSLNEILLFVALGISQVPEYAVETDPRTRAAVENPDRALAINSTKRRPRGRTDSIAYEGRYYSVNDTAWDRHAFILLNQLFQMTVTDVSGVGAPIITISK